MKTTTPAVPTFAERGGWWVVAQIPVLLIIILLSPWTGQVGSVKYPIQFAGIALVAVGIALLAAGLYTLGKSLTPFPRPRHRGELHVNGVYAWMRHPVYAGVIFIALGWAFVWASPFGVLWAIATAVFFDRKAMCEERWMQERFPEYTDYAQRVSRFVPGVY